jgi:hypothetical protein
LLASPARVLALLPAAVLLLAGGLLAAEARAQGAVRPDGRAGRGPWLNARVYPLAVWGPKVGFGAAAGLVLHDAVRPGTVALLTVAPAQYQQVATLSFATGDPLRERAYGVASLRAERTERQWFHGLGPAAHRDDRVALRKQSVEAGLKAGLGLAGRRVVVQPRVGLRVDGTDGVYNVEDGAFGRLDAASAASVQSALGERPGADARQTGVTAGLDLVFDTRDRAFMPRRGVLLHGGVTRYAGLSGTNLGFWRLMAEGRATLPITGAHRIDARAVVEHLSDAGSDVPLPFYLLPSLDGRDAPGFARDRFFGRSVTLASLAYRFPLFQPLGVLLGEGFVAAYAANAYDDLGEQFRFGLSFDRDPSPEAERYAVRPSAAVGVRVGPSFRDNAYVGVALGVSPEGVSAVRVRFVHRLRRVRPRHHF